MSGKLNNHRGSGATAVNTLASWSCQLHDATTSLSGYGTVLVSQSIDALGNSTRTWTDSAGRTLRSIDQLDRLTTVTYDSGGNQLTVRDPNSVGADMVYDSLGRNTKRTDTFGDVTKTDYDRAGNAVKETDAKNKYTLIAFDPRNRRKSTTDRISAGTNFAYTALSQLASLTDAESQAIVYTYDARGSKLTEQYPDHVSSSAVGTTGYGIVTFVYDNAGRVQRKQDQAGDTCSYNFDLAGRMTSRNYRTLANSPSGTIADTDTFTFDRIGRMLTAVSGRYSNTVTYTFDPIGRKASESLTIASQTYTVGSEFNARNELVKYTYPDSSIANRAYTARGALSELKLDSSVIDTRSYDDGGRMTTDVLGNGITETRAYRTDNLLSTISFSNTNIGNAGYSWDANKNKTAETIGGVMSAYGFTLTGTTYDDEDRLTGYQRAATSGSALLAQSWALTSVGDWSTVTTNGTAVTRTHGTTHELLTSGGQNVTTDVKGNQTGLPASLATQAAQIAFTWDFDNKLKSSDIDNNGSADVTFDYDALGRRVSRTEGSTAVVYFQADQQTIADYPRGSAASTATYRYVYGSYIDEPVVRKTTGSGGTVLYYHRNQQYSIYALTDSSGAVSERYAYTAYGQPTFLNASATVQTSSVAGNRYTYTAREWDPTLGLHSFRARWMSGLTGRFLTRDPIGFLDGYNLFESYLRLSRVDPSGLETIRFEFNAFISGSRGTWLPEPVTSTFWDREFKTDGRTFGERGTSRISTKGSIESCAIGLGSPGANTTVGASHLRRRSVAIHPCIGTICGGDWQYFENTASLDVDDIKGTHSKPPCQSKIRIKAATGYPFVPLSPNIDYDVSFTFTVIGKDNVLIEFTGTHNKFPDYEAILEKGSNRQVIYSRMSPDSGPTPINLNSSVSANAAASVTVPTPACCSTPAGSCGQ